MASYSVPVSNRESRYQLRKIVCCQRNQSLANSFRDNQTIEMVQDRGRMLKKGSKSWAKSEKCFSYCSHEIS